MKSRDIKITMETIGQLTNISKELNINKKAIEIHSSTLTKARKKLDEYSTQYKNTEYMKTLSPIEQQCLMENAQVLYNTHEKLVKEIDYLDMTKQPIFISKAVLSLEKAYLLSEYLYKNILGECADIVIPNFTHIQTKYVDKTEYKQLVSSMTKEFESFIHKVYKDFFIFNDITTPSILTPTLYSIYNYLIESYMWFSKEASRLEVEALPEINKIELPKEKVPAVPEFEQASKAKN